MILLELAVERLYTTGRRDSNGVSTVESYLTPCQSIDEADALFRQFLSRSNTCMVKAYILNERKDRYEPFCIGTPGGIRGDFRLTLPAGCKDRRLIQQTLF